MNIYESAYSIKHNIHYLNRYITFIQKCQLTNVELSDDIYTEVHHILPRKLFPQFSKDKTNLVVLTARQHFIAHWILWKVYGKEMAHAFLCMKMKCKNKNNRYYNVSSRTFAMLREDLSKWQTGKTFADKFGEERALQISAKLSKMRKGKIHSRKLTPEQVLEIRQIYNDKSIEFSNVGTVARNGKVLTYERALAKHLSNKYDMSETGLYKVITQKVFAHEN